jgi:hypothetical protein
MALRVSADRGMFQLPKYIFEKLSRSVLLTQTFVYTRNCDIPRCRNISHGIAAHNVSALFADSVFIMPIDPQHKHSRSPAFLLINSRT